MEVKYIVNTCPSPPAAETVRACQRAATETASELFTKGERTALQKLEDGFVDAAKRIQENDAAAVRGRLAAAEKGLVGNTPAEKIEALTKATDDARNAPLLHKIAEQDFHAAESAMAGPGVRLLEAVVAAIGNAISELPQIALPEPLPRWKMSADLTAVLATRLNVLGDFMRGEIANIHGGQFHIARFWLARSGTITLADDGNGLQRLPE